MADLRRERPDEICWKLQIQYKPGEPWHDHTGALFWREDADALMKQERADNPERRYRLLRMTVTYTVEPER